jgi:hypothetical protein
MTVSPFQVMAGSAQGETPTKRIDFAEVAREQQRR